VDGSDVSQSSSAQLAVILDAASGPVFVKGLPISHPGVVRQHREAMINSYISRWIKIGVP
jgi:hypothetical protein